MANYSEHLNKAVSNIKFLSHINLSTTDCCDWQVTVCFYTALHLINAHIVKTVNCNYLSHTKVDTAINPYSLSPSKIDEDTYKSYTKLYNLSRLSRYMLKENYNPNVKIHDGSITSDRHLKKAISHLDKVIYFFSETYGEKIPKITLNCIELRGVPLKNFKITT